MVIILSSRTIKETLSDRLLLLWLLYDAMKFKAIGDTKAHKLGYLSELSMKKDQEKGFNYDFKKLPYGPYSEQLQKDADWLEEQKLIDSRRFAEGKIFQNSRFGRKLLNDFSDLFIRNNRFTQKIFAVNSKYASLNTFQLVEEVHQQGYPDLESVKIDEVEIGEIILYRLSSENAKVEFDIRPEELATLEVYLDDEAYGSAMHAFESAKRKPLLRMDEVL
jgi:uncharacterized protein YwgA